MDTTTTLSFEWSEVQDCGVYYTDPAHFKLTSMILSTSQWTLDRDIRHLAYGSPSPQLPATDRFYGRS